MSIINNLQNHIQQRQGAALEFLKDLVTLNSFTFNPDGIEVNAQRIIKQFEPLGFEVTQTQCTRPGAGRHLVLDSGGSGPAVALISHLDTVYPKEVEEANNFSWKVQGDRIFGPGTNDIKGGTMGIWLILDALSAHLPQLFKNTRWIVAFNAAEEGLSPDFKDICLAHLPKETRACLVFESDSGSNEEYSVINARKGKGTFELTAKGRNAHAGANWAKGANAITQLSRVIDRLHNLTDLDKEVTVNVGLVSGGSGVNVVPAQAQAKFEMRAFDQKLYQQTKDKIMALEGPGDVASVQDKLPCQVEIKLTQETAPWEENAQSNKLAEIWQKAATESGHKLTSQNRGGLSDGNRLWNIFPTMDGLGPGGANAHCAEASDDGSKEQEYIDVASIVPKTLINCVGIKNLLEG